MCIRDRPKAALKTEKVNENNNPNLIGIVYLVLKNFSNNTKQNVRYSAPMGKCKTTG